MSIEIELTYSHLGRIADELRSKAGRVVRATAFDIRDGFRERSPEDTGAQKVSAYVVTHQSSTYGDAAQAARDANPDVELLPEVPHPEPLAAIVAVAAAHGAINEFGGDSHPAQPALIPAAEAAKPRFVAAMHAVLGE